MKPIHTYKYFYLCPYFGRGGTQEYTIMLANYFNKIDEVNLFMPFDSNQKIFDKKINDGVKKIKIPNNISNLINSKNKLKLFYGIFQLSLILKKKINQYTNIKIIIHTNLDPFSFFILNNQLKGKNIFLLNTFHDFGKIKKVFLRKEIYSIIYKLFIKKYHFITPSDYIKKQLMDHVIETKDKHLSVINTGIKPIKYNYIYKFQKTIKVAVTGRLSFAKAWDVLLNVVLKIKNNKKQKFIFNWYGTGEDEIILRRIIKDKKIDDLFILHGGFSNINSVLSKNDVFLFSSRYEGGCLPRGLQEAMYFGIPCIIPTIPSIMEKIEDKKFYFKYKTENEKSLLNVLNIAYKNQQKFKSMSKNAFAYIKSNHSALMECQETSKLYSELLGI